MTVTFYALQKLRASDVQAIIDDRLMVAKPSATTRISNATLAADPHLVLTLQASYTYVIRGVMYVSSGTTPDAQFALSFPAGATTPFGGVRMVTTSAGATGDVDVGAYTSATSGTSNLGVGGSGGTQTTLIEATIVMSTTAGDVTVLWAQNTNTASNTVLETGSHLMAYRIR